MSLPLGPSARPWREPPTEEGGLTAAARSARHSDVAATRFRGDQPRLCATDDQSTDVTVAPFIPDLSLSLILATPVQIHVYRAAH